MLPSVTTPYLSISVETTGFGIIQHWCSCDSVRSGMQFHPRSMHVGSAEIAWKNGNRIPSWMHAHGFSCIGSVIAAGYRSARKSKMLIWTSTTLIFNLWFLIMTVWSPHAFSPWLCLLPDIVSHRVFSMVVSPRIISAHSVILPGIRSTSGGASSLRPLLQKSQAFSNVQTDGDLQDISV